MVANLLMVPLRMRARPEEGGRPSKLTPLKKWSDPAWQCERPAPLLSCLCSTTKGSCWNANNRFGDANCYYCGSDGKCGIFPDGNPGQSCGGNQVCKNATCVVRAQLQCICVLYGLYPSVRRELWVYRSQVVWSASAHVCVLQPQRCIPERCLLLRLAGLFGFLLLIQCDQSGGRGIRIGALGCGWCDEM